MTTPLASDVHSAHDDDTRPGPARRCEETNMETPWLARVTRPYVRLELPFWWPLYRAVGGDDDALWTRAPQRTLHSKLHRYSIPVRLSDWSERRSWFLGRYYELETQLFLSAALRPGDVFADVGANIGMITLLACAMVGPDGLVHAVEPNPEAASRLRAALESNRIDIARVHPVGVADREDVLELRILGDHTGSGTFARLDEHELGEVGSTHRVRVMRGDDLLTEPHAGEWTLKIDVEGFECRALRGLEHTIRSRRPAVLVELIAPQLERAGASVGELFALLRDYDLVAFRTLTCRRGLAKELVLEAVNGPRPDLSENLVCLPRDGEHMRRLMRNPHVHLRLERS